MCVVFVALYTHHWQLETDLFSNTAVDERFPGTVSWDQYLSSNSEQSLFGAVSVHNWLIALALFCGHKKGRLPCIACFRSPVCEWVPICFDVVTELLSLHRSGFHMCVPQIVSINAFRLLYKYFQYGFRMVSEYTKWFPNRPNTCRIRSVRSQNTNIYIREAFVMF
jgi:hypothetical protein